jgi:serine/threonine protein phosphatase PrpC
MQCPSCTAVLPEEDVFCEVCGQRIAPAEPSEPAACPCGASAEEIGDDGFCGRCGHRARRPEDDHREVVLSPDCAGGSDRGLKHSRNEDRFAMQQAGGGYAMAVCDGVSSSKESELASFTVAENMSAMLAAALKSGALKDPENTMRNAIADSESKIMRILPSQWEHEPPSTTVVAALVAGMEATIAWVGDSRAYWISKAGSRALTKDHSWMNEVVADGEMTREQAEKSPKAHAITRWLGADAGENAKADVVRFAIPGPGYLLLCSDGLWNYAPEPEQLARLLYEAEAKAIEAIALVRSLIDFACMQGGHDNITAILLRVEAKRG